MTGTREVIVHQLRQIVVYTFYLGMFQCLCFKYDLSPVWSAITLLTLLALSIYEDSLLIDQVNMPEPVMVVRIWACNFPFIIANLILNILDRSFLMTVEQSPGSKIPGQPLRMMVTIWPKSGVVIIDEFFLICGYYLYYFSAVAMFRSLINQFRFVRKLMELNTVWSPNVGSIDTSPMVFMGQGR